MNRTRRRLVGAAGAAAVGGAGWALWRYRTGSDVKPVKSALAPDPMFPNALQVPGDEGLHGIADVGGSFTLVSGPVKHEILRGKPVTML
ncbi:MAG: hypothetical protein ACXWCH_30770, partial [Burkholderiales bacterium]